MTRAELSVLICNRFQLSDGLQVLWTSGRTLEVDQILQGNAANGNTIEVNFDGVLSQRLVGPVPSCLSQQIDITESRGQSKVETALKAS